MAIRKTSKEELKDQVKWFLDYVEKYRTSSYWKKTIDEISEILWLKEPEKRGFYEWLSKKFWKELDISDKWEIEKTLKKKHIDFERIWKKYIQYLRIRRMFEKYEILNPELNDDIIKFIIEQQELGDELNMKNLKIFLSSNIYKDLSKTQFNTDVLYTINCLDTEDLSKFLEYFTVEDLIKLSNNRYCILWNKGWLSIVLDNLALFDGYDFDYILAYIKELDSALIHKWNSDNNYIEFKNRTSLISEHSSILKKYKQEEWSFLEIAIRKIIKSVEDKRNCEKIEKNLQLLSKYLFLWWKIEDFDDVINKDFQKFVDSEIDTVTGVDFYNKIWSPFSGDNGYLSDEQINYLRKSFDWNIFDLSDSETLQRLFKLEISEYNYRVDILTMLKNFNIIKVELPEFSSDVFKNELIASHLYKNKDPKKLRDCIKQLKEMWFSKNDEFIELFSYGSNNFGDWNYYFPDFVDITKLYLINLDISTKDLLDIYRTLFHHYEHKNSLEPMFSPYNAAYIDLYKKPDNLIALKELWLSNKAIISSQFTPIEVFQKLIDLWITVDEINKVFDQDPKYNWSEGKRFELFIQDLLTSNFYMYYWHNVKQTLNWDISNVKIENLYSLLASSKRKYILPFLHEFLDNANVYIDLSQSYKTEGQKILEMIDAITDKINIEEFIQFLKRCDLWGDIVRYVGKMELIVNYFNISEVGILESLKKIIVNGSITIENLEMVFGYRSVSIDELISMNELLASASSWNLEMVFKKYPNITISELIWLKDVLWFQYFASNFGLIHDYFEPFEYWDFKTYKKLISFSGEFPKDLQFKDPNHRWYLEFLDNIAATSYDYDKKILIMRKVVSLPVDEAEKYLKIFKMFDDSISMDVQRIKNELIDEILKSEKPEKIAEDINNIFERNNLPLTWKIFKVFELLYPKDKFKTTLESHWSPVLHQFLDEWKNVYPLIYRDLMNIAIKSGDRSLKNYINTFIWSEAVLKKFENVISEPWFDANNKFCLEWRLEEKEQEQLLYLFRRCSVLYNRYYWKDIQEWIFVEDKALWMSNISDNQLVKFYNSIKEWFHLKNGESIYDRLQRFLWWLWYRSFEEVLHKMNESKQVAHEHWLKLYNESNWWKIKFPQRAFLKWVDENAFSQIINRWLTCREYLWWWENWRAAWSDWTPFDVDWWYTDSFVDRGYGKVKIVIDTKKESIYDSREKWVEWYENEKYELFMTWYISKEHYGIRTWIPTTEVDYVIYTGNFESREFQTICYDIARNGYYVPITDSDGNIRFTPEMYHKIRLWFNYMKYYDWFDVEFKDWKYESKESDNRVHRNNGNRDMIRLIEENSPQNEKYKSFAKENKELAESTIKWIKQILEEKCWIKFNSKYDSSITWAELHDSWSTWRWTDIPTKDVDLDFTLILDAKDYERVAEIARVIHEEIWTQKDSDHWVVEWWNQIKSKVNNIGKSEERPNGIPLDLLILKKSQIIDYSSSDAMKEKLEYIASNPNSWAEDLDRVRTNVIIMKKLLKAKWCYKKPEWWISGIWVENRIIQNHWSFIEALESFEQIAYWWEYEEWKEPKSLTEFQELYPIYDAGENYKDWCNDNFVYKLQENWYKWTLEIVKTYRLEWMNWIRRLIMEYEQKKADYI